MPREHADAHALMAKIEADLELVEHQREQLETQGHDHFHKAMQAHLPNMTEDTVDGWLRQQNALRGAQEARAERLAP